MTSADPISASPAAPQRRGFGIDVGGSGIKGGIVDLDTGQLIGDRVKLLTPQPATPKAVAKTIADVVREFDWTGPLGVTYPGVVTHGIVRTAANVDKSWIGLNAADLISAQLNGQPVTVLNDADAAGLAEERYGAGRDATGEGWLCALAVVASAALGRAAIPPGPPLKLVRLLPLFTTVWL